MRYRLSDHLSACKARGGIIEAHIQSSAFSQGSWKSSGVLLTREERYSTSAQSKSRIPNRSSTANPATRRSPRARDTTFTPTKGDDWLTFDLDDGSIPEQVHLSAWRIKVLDVANVVSQADVAQLHTALQEFRKARAKLKDRSSHFVQPDIQANLIKTFDGIRRRSEKAFEAQKEQRHVSQISAEEANLRRKVAHALNDLEDVQSVQHNGSETKEREAPPSVKPVTAGEMPEALRLEEEKEIRLEEEKEIRLEEERGMKPETTDPGRKGRLKRFLPENTQEWLRAKRRQRDIAWADEDAQNKLKRFHFYLSEELSESTAIAVEEAEAEYENALERRRLLSLDYGTEDGVIIKHKPSRPPPIVVQPQLPMNLESTHTEKVPVEISIPKEESPSVPKPDVSESVPHKLPDVAVSEPLEQPVFLKAPVKTIATRTGLFASVHRVYKQVASALANPWKTLVRFVRKKKKSTRVTHIPQTRFAKAHVETPGTPDDIDSLGTPKQPIAEKDAATSESRKGNGFLRFMRGLQAEVNARAGPKVESTDWVSMGYQNYGHWLSSRLHKPLAARESAYIDHMLSASRQSPFVKRRHRQAWRDQIAGLGRDHGRYAGEVTDPRIVVHLNEILPSHSAESDNLSADWTWQQVQAVSLLKSLQAEPNVLEVHTDGSFWEGKDGQSQSGGGIVLQTEPDPIRETCYMGSMMHHSSEAEMGAIYRGLQILRDTLRTSTHSKDMSRYSRILIATDSIQCLEALVGYSVWHSELWKMTRVAALCRMEAYDIVKENNNIQSIDFLWLPRLTAGNADADLLARSGRLSGFNFMNDDRSSTSEGNSISLIADRPRVTGNRLRR